MPEISQGYQTFPGGQNHAESAGIFRDGGYLMEGNPRRNLGCKWNENPCGIWGEIWEVSHRESPKRFCAGILRKCWWFSVDKCRCISTKIHNNDGNFSRDKLRILRGYSSAQRFPFDVFGKFWGFTMQLNFIGENPVDLWQKF